MLFLMREEVILAQYGSRTKEQHIGFPWDLNPRLHETSFFSYVWDSGLLYHIFYFLWSDFESFWHLLTKENGQHMHTKEIIQLSLEDIIIGVVNTKRHLLNNYSLYANHW